MISNDVSAQRSTDDAVSDKIRYTAVVLVMVGFGVLLFALDLATPLGVADGIGYAPLLTVTLFLSGRRATIVGAFVFTALIIVGQLFGVGGVGEVAIVNRVLALTSLWIVAAVLIERKTAQAQFDAATRKDTAWLERLFGYVPDRTADARRAGLDPNIWEAANLYATSYGDRARFRAEERAREFLRQGDSESYAIWVQVASVIEVLQRPHT